MNFISPELVRLLGWTLLHFVWEGAAVSLLLLTALAFCRKATVRYAVSVGALLLMLALPVATLFLLQQNSTSTDAVTNVAPSAVPVASGAPGPLAEHRALRTKEPQAAAQPELMLWLVRAWMVGVMLFAMRGAGGFVVMQRLRKVATTPASDELLRLCRLVQERMRIQRAVRFCRSAALQVPAVIGGLRPIVLLPVSALTGLTHSQIEAIVAHELAHIRRYDYFVNLFQLFVETVLFYHPAVWWVNQRIRSERENCCDDMAIAVCGNRLEYVRALTHLESLRVTPQLAMAANGSPLKDRVRRLLGMAQESEGVRSGSSLLGVLVIGAVVLAATSLATGAKQAEKPAQDATSKPWEQPIAPTQAAPATEAPQKPSAAIAPTHEADVETAEPQEQPAEPQIANMPSHMVMVPPIHVHVPAVNVDVPAMAVHNNMVTMAMPAIAVHIPKMNIDMPAMHLGPFPGQAATPGANTSQPAESYIEGMKGAGLGDLTVDELIGLRVQGVTPEYVRDMRAAGMKIDADELMAMKVQGVTPEYVKEMRAAYPGIDSDTIIGFKVQNVTPQYVAEFTKLGVKADADEIMGLKVQGVTAEYIRDMRATGVNFDTDELIGMKVQGVTPAYVSALKAANIGKLDADEIIGAKAVGITPEFIEKAKSHGFKDLDLEKLIELKNAGVL